MEEKSTKQEIRYLVRIVNTDLEGNKPIKHALLKIKGIGTSFANMVCTLARIDKSAKTGLLTSDQVKLIETIITSPLNHGAPVWMVNRRRDYETNQDQHLLAANISFVQDNDIKRMKKIKCYKGVRHILGQPVRGQRTRSNFRKNKGKVKLGVVRAKTVAPQKEDKK